MSNGAAVIRKAIGLGLLVLTSSALAEDLSGVLEKGQEHHAMFLAGAESGDLIGYLIKSNSDMSKKVEKSCLSGMVCNLSGVSTREYSGPSPAGFQDDPVAWFEIVSFKNGSVGSLDLEYQSEVDTRFGKVSYDDESFSLSLKNKQIPPPPEVNSLSIIMQYETSDSDVLLIQNAGGASCPALYHFVVLSKSGVSVSKQFGTCTDIIYPTFDGKNLFVVNMIGFAGPEEPENVQRKAASSKHSFSFDSTKGLLQENGRHVE